MLSHAQFIVYMGIKFQVGSKLSLRIRKVLLHFILESNVTYKKPGYICDFLSLAYDLLFFPIWIFLEPFLYPWGSEISKNVPYLVFYYSSCSIFYESLQSGHLCFSVLKNILLLFPFLNFLCYLEV